MKNIYIGGIAKSGKSRLANKLCEERRYNHIPMDYFASSFKRNFRDLGITSNVKIDKESSKKLALFLSRFIEIVDCQNEENFIIDSAHIYPDDIIQYLDLDKWDIYFLGYPNTSPQEKLLEVKKYIKDGWIESRTDEELLQTFTDLIDLSQEIKRQCDINGIKFIDTSNCDVIKVYNEI